MHVAHPTPPTQLAVLAAQPCYPVRPAPAPAAAVCNQYNLDYGCRKCSTPKKCVDWCPSSEGQVSADKKGNCYDVSAGRWGQC